MSYLLNCVLVQLTSLHVVFLWTTGYFSKWLSFDKKRIVKRRYQHTEQEEEGKNESNELVNKFRSLKEEEEEEEQAFVPSRYFVFISDYFFQKKTKWTFSSCCFLVFDYFGHYSSHFHMGRSFFEFVASCPPFTFVFTIQIPGRRAVYWWSCDVYSVYWCKSLFPVSLSWYPSPPLPPPIVCVSVCVCVCVCTVFLVSGMALGTLVFGGPRQRLELLLQLATIWCISPNSNNNYYSTTATFCTDTFVSLKLICPVVVYFRVCWWISDHVFVWLFLVSLYCWRQSDTQRVD